MRQLIAAAVLATSAGLLCEQPSGLAQTEDLIGVTTEGVPEDVEPDQGVTEVEKAIEQVEDDTEAGLPANFTIEFGDTYDWLRLTSGEWLKGEVHWMREKDIEFDSDKLDLLTFSWSKVSQLHSPRINTYVFEGRVDVAGRAVVTKEQVIIETEDGVVSYPRDELLAILEGAQRERNWWSTRLSVGFNANAGNTNQGQLLSLIHISEPTRLQ